MPDAGNSSGAPVARILFYAMNYAPEIGGCGRLSGELGSYLAAAGARMEVVTTPPHYPGWFVREPYRKFQYSEEVRDGVRVFRCPLILRRKINGFWRVLAPFSFAFFSAPVALWRMFAARPQTVMVVEPSLSLAPLALLGAWLLGSRSILHVQDLEVDAAFAVGHLRGAWLRRMVLGLERAMLRRFGMVVTISEEMRAKLVDKGVRPERLHVIRNWVDLTKILPMADVTPFRSALSLPASAYVALYSGNIGPKQALDVVMEAADELQSNPDIVFVIAGDGPAKADLQERFGHLPNVRFLPPQPEAKLCELMNLADLHLLPQSRNAADLMLPSKLGGMLASGRDILVTADAGTELHRFLEGTAAIVPSGDSMAMAREILSHAARGRKVPQRPHAIVSALDARQNLAQFARLLLPGQG